MKLKIINDENFEAEILKSEIPAILMFDHEACPYCKATLPILEHLADELFGKTKFGIISAVDNATSIALGVESVPHIFIYNAGKQIDNILGLRSAEELTKKIKDALNI